jgi:diguanylate cyclase (GGDEF)-like protein
VNRMPTIRASPDISVSLYADAGTSGETVARRVIAGLTFTFGVAGMLLIPSGQFSGIGTVMIGIGCLSTVPVALVWLKGPWSPRALAVPFIVYSDLGILVVLTGLAIGEGVDTWVVVSRAVTIGSLFASPFILQAYIRHLRLKAQGAMHDPLTGLFNRRGLFRAVERLNGVGMPGPSDPSAISVMVVDIDRFKSINDRFGHPSGDAVLTEVAARLLRTAGELSAVARLGGDEFVCVHIGTRVDVDAAEERMLAALEESFTGPTFTTSVGTAGETVRRGDATHQVVRRLIAVADIEMYRNKSMPNADTRVHMSTVTRPGFDILGVRDRVDRLIASGGPTIVFQPIVETSSRKVLGYEALSRFPYGHGSPMLWFRDATDAGIGPRLELAAIDRALADMCALPGGAFVAINASAETIRTTDLLSRLVPHLAHRTIYVEITEHERVDDYSAVAQSVADLRAAGVLISIDDVGAGFSGLRQVVELKPDTLKVDYTLVHGIDSDPHRRAAAASLAAFAKDIGATLIMEGVETEAELAVAVELGADMAQGFLLGRPQPT